MKNSIRPGYFFNPDTRQLLIIKHDDNAEDPRGWDNLTTMLCKHKRYNFGDTTESARYDIDGIKALAKEFALRKSGAKVLYVNDNDESDIISAKTYWKLKREGYYDEIYTYVAGREDYSKLSDTNKVLYCAPLFIYDHSGVTMWMGQYEPNIPPSHRGWDTSCVGYIVIFRSDVVKYYPDCDKKPLEFWEEICNQDVKTYDTYLTGDVFWYRLVKIDEDYDEGEDDSCCGFFNGDEALPHLLSHTDITLQQFKDDFTELNVDGRYGCGCSGEEMERALSAIEEIYMKRLEEEFA